MFSISSRPTISEIHKLYQDQKATPSQVIKFFLNRIKETDLKIFAFEIVLTDPSLQTAQEQDQELESKTWEEIISSKPLFGIPFGNKAIIQAEGQVFSASSKILKDFVAPYSSTAYQKITEAGAIMIGICNMDAHAMGASGETSDFGVSRNPFDTSRVCGGSSSGSAACVASGQAVFALGTDTGGSIRQPACFTDLVGIKPTYGAVSRWGVQPMASSLDQVGGLTNTVEDNAIIMTILAGKDPKDMTTIDSKQMVIDLQKNLKDRKSKRQQTKLSKTQKPLKIGIPDQFYIDGIDPQIKQALQDLHAKLTQIGHTLVPIKLSLTTSNAIAIYYMTTAVEVASNYQRIDGVRYAKQEREKEIENQPETQKLSEKMFFDHRNTFFPPETKRRIMLGSYASSAGYYDAYYNHSQKVRAMAIDQFNKAFEQCDLMVVPTSPEFPFKIGQKTDDPVSMYLSDVFTCLINPIKTPSLAVPLGLFEYKQKHIEIFDNSSPEDKKLPLAPERKRAVALINVIGTDKFVVFSKNGDKSEYYNDEKARFLPGGMIEKDETQDQAAQRETLEEVGVDNLQFVKEIATCHKFLRYQDTLSNSLETYILYQITLEDYENRVNSEADSKKYTVGLATLQELEENNWNQLNWVIDILRHKMDEQEPSDSIMLPTGCQILGPKLSESLIYTLGFEIEAITKNQVT